MSETGKPLHLTEGWHRSGTTVYALTQDGWRKGEPNLVNRWTLHVQPTRFIAPEEMEQIATLVQAAPVLYRALEQLAFDVRRGAGIALIQDALIDAIDALSEARGETPSETSES